MTARTKLDEIVDEELRAGIDRGDPCRAFGTRVAERAFRHGVEQTKKAATIVEPRVWLGQIMDGAEIRWGDVQPAPAEENTSVQEYCDCGMYAMRHVRQPNCSTVSFSSWHRYADRRKGERRKSYCGSCNHDSHRGRVCQFNDRCECCAGWIPFWCDRRSGKDRRKP